MVALVHVGVRDREVGDCAIVSSNLDEFFAVRVAGLLDQVRSRIGSPYPDGRNPAETLADCRAQALDLKAAQTTLWLDVLRPALAKEASR